MSDVLRQIDEDLRKDRLINLWRKYGIYILSFIIIVILSVVGFQFKSSIDKRYNEKLVEEYINATNIEDIDQKFSLFENLINSNNDLLASFAELKISNLQIERGAIEDGQSVLEKIIQNNEYDPIIRDLATYYLLMLKIDSISQNEFESYLDDTRIQSSSFKYLFREIIAIKKIIDGNIEAGKNDLQKIISLPDAPSDIRIRAEKFIEIAK